MVTGDRSLERSGQLSRMLDNLKSSGVQVHRCRIAGEPSPAMVDGAVNDFRSKAIDGMRHLIPALPDACGKGASDLGRRGAVAYGAFLSGVTLANAGLGVVHGVAGPMGGIVAIPHGVACANLLPFAVRVTVENLTAMDTELSNTTIEKFARIGKIFGALHEDCLDCCRHLVDCLYRWLDQLDIPRLGQFGLTAAHVDLLVRAASNKNNPLPLSAGQIRQMIQDRH